MMQGTKQNVAINSSPSSATVYLNGTNIGPTPMAAELSRKNTRSNITKIGQTPFQNCFKDIESSRFPFIAFAALFYDEVCFVNTYGDSSQRSESKIRIRELRNGRTHK
jgi:hypothetical protein